jgi:hypothetical protein
MAVGVNTNASTQNIVQLHTFSVETEKAIDNDAVGK